MNSNPIKYSKILLLAIFCMISSATIANGIPAKKKKKQIL